MLDAAERRLVARCDALMEDALALTRDLVQGYSVLGKEQDALDTMEAWFARLGLSSERVPLDAPGFADHPHRAPVSWSSDGRYNLVVRLEPEAGGPHLVLNGHLDVVPAEPVDMWTRPPWEPWERDGWLYGRGAGDMKAGIAAMVMAVQAVRDCDGEIGIPLTLQTVIEEECSGNGALACLHQGFGGDFALIPEPFGARLYTGQVGVLWFHLRVDGEPAHVLDPGAGSSAIQRLLDYLPVFEALEREINCAPRPPAYADMASPFHLSLGTIQGGNWPSSVPAHAEVEGRIGFPPGVAPRTIMERVRHAIRQRHAELDDGPPPRVHFPGFRSEGHLVDMDDPAMDLLSRCHEDLTGTSPPPYLSTCTTDLRAFHVAGGINGTCYGPVAERIHGVDECVEIDSIRRVMTTYALFIHRWSRQA